MTGSSGRVGLRKVRVLGGIPQRISGPCRGSPFATQARSGRAVGLLADPGDELLDVRMGPQSFQGVVVALQLLVVEDRVDVTVARGAQADGAVYLLPVEGLLVSFVLVARPGDEVVARQPLHRAAAESALPAPRAVGVAHPPILSTRGRAMGERVRRSGRSVRQDGPPGRPGTPPPPRTVPAGPSPTAGWDLRTCPA